MVNKNNNKNNSSSSLAYGRRQKWLKVSMWAGENFCGCIISTSVSY